MADQEYDPEWSAARARQVDEVQSHLVGLLARARAVEGLTATAGLAGAGDYWTRPLVLALVDVSAAVASLDRASVMVREPACAMPTCLACSSRHDSAYCSDEHADEDARFRAWLREREQGPTSGGRA